MMFPEPNERPAHEFDVCVVLQGYSRRWKLLLYFIALLGSQYIVLMNG